MSEFEPHETLEEEMDLDMIFKWGAEALVQSEMEADSAYDQFFCDAPSPSFDAKLSDGVVLRFRRDNTLVMEYPHYPDFDHVVVSGDQGQTYYMWRQKLPEVYSRATELGFDVVRSVVPTRNDYDLWMETQIGDAMKQTREE